MGSTSLKAVHERDARRLVALALAVALTAGIVAGLIAWRDGNQAEGLAPRGADVSDESRSALPGERGLSPKPGTRKEVGRFALRGGRVLEVRTLETTDGMSCLVDVERPSLLSGSACHHGELFSANRVVWVINADGGPARFTDQYLVGIAAPDVALVELELTDGTRVTATPNATGAFVVQSSVRELALDIHPTSLHAYGRRGALLETQDIGPPR